MVRQYLENNLLVFDGAMGSYYQELSGVTTDSELANINNPALVSKILEEYLLAGARAIKTNTFKANKEFFAAYKEIIKKGIYIAKNAAEIFDGFVFCDIGPSYKSEYIDTVEAMIEYGGKNFLFETLPTYKGIDLAVKKIKEKVKDSYIIVSFSVNAQGYSNDGEYFVELLNQANHNPFIDGIGLNCSTGPHHLLKLMKYFPPTDKQIYISPNASYPTIVSNRTYYGSKEDYYCNQIKKIIKSGATIVGGCCGTNPNYIELITKELPKKVKVENKNIPKTIEKKEFENPLILKLNANKKIVLVELDTPKIDDLGKFMERAKQLKSNGVDAITIADNPMGFTRMSSSIVACKVKRELNLDVIPHLTCRDRNISATKSLLLGLSVENIHNVLLITGDPLPSALKDEVKAVYEFNSRKMCRYVNSLNETTFTKEFTIMGALNVNALKFEIQLKLAKEKQENGAKILLTQPIMSKEALENLKMAKEELDCKILAGILPVVSYRNAIFINNEIPGMNVSEKVVEQYKDLDREQAEELAFSICSKQIDATRDYCDGYYLMTPLNRVDLISKLVKYIQK